MIIVRNVFVARPGQASTLAAMFKTAAAASRMSNPRVMTDLTGEFNRVVLEYEVADWSGVEAMREEYATNEQLRSALKGYTDLYLTGHRELLQVL